MHTEFPSREIAVVEPVRYPTLALRADAPSLCDATRFLDRIDAHLCSACVKQWLESELQPAVWLNHSVLQRTDGHLLGPDKHGLERVTLLVCSRSIASAFSFSSDSILRQENGKFCNFRKSDTENS